MGVESEPTAVLYEQTCEEQQNYCYYCENWRDAGPCAAILLVTLWPHISPDNPTKKLPQKRPTKVLRSHPEPCDVCNHVGQKCIASDIEGHPEAHVTRALVQLTRQLAIAHVELAQSVAGRQSHGGQVCGRERVGVTNRTPLNTPDHTCQQSPLGFQAHMMIRRSSGFSLMVLMTFCSWSTPCPV